MSKPDRDAERAAYQRQRETEQMAADIFTLLVVERFRKGERGVENAELATAAHEAAHAFFAEQERRREPTS